MSRYSFALAGAVALVLSAAGTQGIRAMPLVAAAPHGHGIILARRECIRTEYRDGRYVCVQWYDCKPGSTVC